MTPPAAPIADPARVRGLVRELLGRRRGRVAGSAAVLVVAANLQLLGPALLGAVVDLVVAGGSLGRLHLLGAAMLAAAVGGAVAARWGTVLTAGVGEDVMADLRTRTFAHAVAVPQAATEQLPPGDLVSRLTDDVTVLTTTVRMALAELAIAFLTIVLTGAALVLVSPVLAAVAVLGLPWPALATRWYLRHSPGRYRREREATAELIGALHETAEAAPVLRRHGRTGQRQGWLGQVSDTRAEAVMDAARVRNHLRPGIVAGQFVALVAVMGVGAVLLARGTVAPGVVVAAALYVQRLFDPVTLVMEVMDELQAAGAALARVAGILQLPTESRHDVAGPLGPGGLEVRDVTFAYRPDRPVLRRVDLAVPAGATVAVIGPSGAGKSTLAALLAGVHAANGGEIRLGGRAVDAAERRAHVLLVTQEVHLFAGTLSDNLRLAVPDAPDEALHAALEAVGAGPWLAVLPAGLRTPVGAGGTALTLAEAQQVALARVLLADPPVVMLDEATGVLHRPAARAVEEATATALAGRTTIWITHRPEAARNADLVVVMEHGRVVACDRPGVLGERLGGPAGRPRAAVTAAASAAPSSDRNVGLSDLRNPPPGGSPT